MPDSRDAVWNRALSAALRGVSGVESSGHAGESTGWLTGTAVMAELLAVLASQLEAEACAVFSLAPDGPTEVLMAKGLPAPELDPVSAEALRTADPRNVVAPSGLLCRLIPRQSPSADPLLLTLRLCSQSYGDDDIPVLAASREVETCLDDVVALLRLVEPRLFPVAGDRERAITAQSRGSVLVKQMLAAPEEAINTTIENALAELAMVLDIDRIEVAIELKDKVYSVTHEWVAPGVRPLISERQALTPDRAPDAWAALFRHGQLLIADSAALDEADPARALLTAREAGCSLALTLQQSGAPFGFIGLETATRGRRFLAAEIELVRTVAVVISTLLARLPLLEEVGAARAQQEREHKRLLATLNALPDVVLDLDEDMRVTDVHANSRVELPIPEVDLIGRTLAEVFPEQVAALTRVLQMQLDREETAMGYRFPIEVRGRTRWYSFSASRRAPDRSGEAHGYVALLRDVTERQVSRIEIERLSRIVQSTNNMVVIADAERRIEWVNAAFEQKTGYTLEEVRGRRPSELLHCPETDPTTIAYMRTRLKEGLPARAELLNRAKDGTHYWVDLNVQPIRNELGRITGYTSVQSDTTERHDHEQRLARALVSEEAARIRLQNAVDMLQDAILLFDADMNLVLCNRTFKHLFPRMAPKLEPGMSLPDFFALGIATESFPKNAPDKNDWVRRQIEDFQNRRRVSRMAEVGGRWLRHVQAPTSDGGRIVLLSDITDLRGAEIRALADRGRALDASRDAMALVGERGVIVHANAAALHLLNYRTLDDVLGLDWHDAISAVAPGDVLQTAEDALSAEGYWRGQMQLSLRDGKKISVEFTASRDSDSGTLYMLRDISEPLRAAAERERMREELALFRRREDMSLMAMSLTHDFNNLLAAISAAAGLIEEGSGAQTRELAETIGTAVEQAAGLVRRLMSLGRKAGSRELLDLRVPLQDAATLVRAGLRPPLQLDLKLTAKPVAMTGDATALMQMAMNLCINARDAIMEHPSASGPGRIRLLLDLEPPQPWLTFDIGTPDPAQRYAHVSIIDDGPGMSAETRANVFTAYYSTKGSRGTGLGVPIAAEAVRDHGGLLALTSAPGQGTRFDIFLPIQRTKR